MRSGLRFCFDLLLELDKAWEIRLWKMGLGKREGKKKKRRGEVFSQILYKNKVEKLFNNIN